MDASERKRFLDTLRQDDDFRAEVRRELLTDELLNLPQTVAVLIEHNAQMQRELTTVRGDVDALVTTTRQLLEITQNVVGEMQQGFAAVRQDIAGVATTIAEVATTIAGVATTIADVQQGFIAVDARFDQVDAEIRDLKNPTAA
jgi:septal ring factor EnvC (AmiA/AmiB activator)